MAAYADAQVWSEFIADARSADFYRLSQEFGCKLKKTGTSEYEGPCPICAGRDRFSINVKKRVCNCRKCGLTGNTIGFVMTVTGCSFVDACERITGRRRPDRSRDETLEEKNARLDTHAKRQAEYRQREEEQQALEAAKAKRDEEAISSILAPGRAVEIVGTHGEAYLRGRGLTPHPRLLRDIMFVPDLDYWGARDNGTRSVVHLATLPAIVAIIRDFSGLPIGISQTYLDPKEPRKWKPEGSPTNSAKKIRGEKKHGMIWLGRKGQTVAIGEGWENCLAWHQLGYGPEDVALAAAVDLGNLAGGATGPWQHPVLNDADGKPVRIVNGNPDLANKGIILPDGVKQIIILADLDSETYSTAAKLRVAVNRFLHDGYGVDLAWPLEPGKDWNDILVGQTEGRDERAADIGASVRAD